MSWTEPGFEAVARLVGSRTGLSFGPDRRAGVEMGVRRAMARAGVADLDRYPAVVALGGLALDDLLSELTVPETYFFREPAQFAFLRRRALPEVLGRRGPGHSVRVWSAACSTGEEAYSLAIVLAEEGLAGRSRVLGTDLSAASLAKARRGIYGAWSVRGESAEVARRHLRPEGRLFAVPEAARLAVEFSVHNLAPGDTPDRPGPPGPTGLDVIFCRNVLIYFGRETVRAVARRLYGALAPGGWLFTASSDPRLCDAAPFEVIDDESGLFYRRPVDPQGDPPPDPVAPLSATPAWLPLPPSPGADGPGPCPGPVTAACGDESAAGAVAAASAELDRGEYAAAAGRTLGLLGWPAANVVHVRALAELNAEGAESACALGVARHPLSAELRALHAVLLAGLGRDDEAVAAARRAIYLDRTLALAHYVLGSVLRRGGDAESARRAFRNARDLCAARPAAEAVALSGGESAGRMAESARVQLLLLGEPGGGEAR